MSRILKRPMFRKGGEVMEGIMTGIKPRRNYAEGTTALEKIEQSNVSPLATGLGTASTLAGIYRLINPAQQQIKIL